MSTDINNVKTPHHNSQPKSTSKLVERSGKGSFKLQLSSSDNRGHLIPLPINLDKTSHEKSFSDPLARKSRRTPKHGSSKSTGKKAVDEKNKHKSETKNIRKSTSSVDNPEIRDVMAHLALSISPEINVEYESKVIEITAPREETVSLKQDISNPVIESLKVSNNIRRSLSNPAFSKSEPTFNNKPLPRAPTLSKCLAQLEESVIELPKERIAATLRDLIQLAEKLEENVQKLESELKEKPATGFSSVFFSGQSSNTIPSQNTPAIDWLGSKKATMDKISDMFRGFTTTPKDLYPEFLKKLPLVKRGAPLTQNEWAMAFDMDGVVTNPDKIREKIFWGGVDPSIRDEVWKYLLDFYDWKSTASRRKQIREKLSQQYNAYKDTWQGLEELTTQMKDLKLVVDNDVKRTDREHPLFKDDSPYLQKLSDILVTFCLYYNDLVGGYAQGMNDMLSPLIVVIEDEIHTFWCFKGLMQKVAKSFQTMCVPQLKALSLLLRYVDPFLYNYLIQIEASDMLFLFQSLLLLFKREFKIEKVKVLWEVLWTNHLTKHFYLFFAMSLILHCRDLIIQNNMRSQDLLMFYKNLSTQEIELEDCLTLATQLYFYFEKNASNSVKDEIYKHIK